MAQATHYTVIFKAKDGEHTASLTYTKPDIERATFWAKKTFGDMFVSIKETTPEEHEQAVAQNLAANPSRVPLDEKTGGNMNRVISEPELAQDD